MDVNANRSPITPERIDLLVDGTLPADERRALLSGLETEPDGWRRCAIAFLEAQAWREAIGPMALAAARNIAPNSSPDRSRHRLRLVPIALAASLALAAFVLGRATVGSGRPEADDRLAGAVVEESPDESPSIDPIIPAPEADDRSLAQRGGETDPNHFDRLMPELRAIGYLNVPTTADPDAPSVQLPILSGPGLDDRWLRDQPSFVPDEFRRRWEDRGYNVELQRRLVSVQLDDAGRYLTIPVDEVLLRESERVTY